MILVVIAVHAVAPDHVQRRITRLALGPHRLDMRGIFIVIDGIGLFPPHAGAADVFLGLAKPPDVPFLRRPRDQAPVPRSPEPVLLPTATFEPDATPPEPRGRKECVG